MRLDLAILIQLYFIYNNNVYERTKVHREELLNDSTVVTRCNDRRRLTMTEAINIKEGPALNSQAERYGRLLKIFIL